MSTKSKSKDKRTGKEQKASSKASATVGATSGVPTSAYNPILGTFHTLEMSATSLAPSVHVNGRFKNIDDSDDHSGSTNGSGGEYDSASNNDSRSVESEEQKDKTQSAPTKLEVVPGADNDKREKIRQKNERKHQRQKEKRAQELHERCSGYLISRKFEAFSQQLVGMGFSADRATMALLLNEGKVEEAVAWLLERGEEADKQIDQSPDASGNLKLDISQELARIAELEIRFKCSKQDVERAVVACEGDIDKAEEILRSQNPAASNLEVAGDLRNLSNGKIPLVLNQSTVRPEPKPGTNSILQQRRDEKDFNYPKAPVTVASPPKLVNKNVQPLPRIPQQKLEWARPLQMATPIIEKRWPVGGSNPSVSYPMASPLQASPTPVKAESNFVPVTGEYKPMQPGMLREPVVVMQRPQTVNAKLPPSNIGFSPPGSSAGWFPSSLESLKPNGLLQPPIPSTRSPSPNNLISSPFYHRPIYPQAQQLISGSGSLDVPAMTRGNSSWGIAGTSPPLAAASLGLFPGNGSACSSGWNSSVNWTTASPMLSCDYNTVDWSLDPGVLPPKPSGLWNTMGSFQKRNQQSYDSNQLIMSMKPAMRLVSPSGNGVSLMGLHEGVDATADASPAVSREWTSPFEEKDLFSIPRQFVSSPSL